MTRDINEDELKRVFFFSKFDLLNASKSQQQNNQNQNFNQKRQQEFVNENLFEELPDEIVLEIFSYLLPKNLINCAFTCRNFNRIHDDWQLWKNIIRNHGSELDFQTVTKDYQSGYYYYSPYTTTNFKLSGTLGIQEHFRSIEKDENYHPNSNISTSISKRTIDKINKEPKKLVVDQMKKYIQAQKNYLRQQKAEEFKRQIRTIKDDYAIKLIEKTLVLSLLVLPSLFFALKFDVSYSIFNWKFCFFPWLYSSLLFFVWSSMEYYTSYSRNTEKYLLQGIITCSGFLTLFFLFISLKLDQNFSISKWWILSPFGLATFTLIILWSIFLYNEPNIFERDIHIFVLFVFYVMAGLLLVFISIIKAFSIYESQAENPSYKGVFIPLIFLSIYPIIGTIFVCIIRHSSYFSRTDYLVFIISCSVGIAFGLFSLILYLRIKGIFHIYTSIVSSFVFFPSLYLQYLILARKL